MLLRVVVALLEVVASLGEHGPDLLLCRSRIVGEELAYCVVASQRVEQQAHGHSRTSEAHIAAVLARHRIDCGTSIERGRPDRLTTAA